VQAGATMKKGDKVKVYRPVRFNGEEWLCDWFEAKVMGVIDGYAMLRRGAKFVPFVESVKTLERWQIKPPKTGEHGD